MTGPPHAPCADCGESTRRALWAALAAGLTGALVTFHQLVSPIPTVMVAVYGVLLYVLTLLMPDRRALFLPASIVALVASASTLLLAMRWSQERGAAALAVWSAVEQHVDATGRCPASLEELLRHQPDAVPHHGLARLDPWRTPRYLPTGPSDRFPGCATLVVKGSLDGRCAWDGVRWDCSSRSD
ncbi:MAG: hypothetical protein H6739_40815 [Alphaproteobacteria bacterium]|nr:hypothetical protein [Alphaproteobacteria bacterium]